MKNFFLVATLFLSAMQSFAQCEKVPQWINSYYEYWGLRTRYVNQLPRRPPSIACRDTAMVYFDTADKKIHWFTGLVDTTFVTGSSTTPNLQAVCTVGDSTNTKVFVYVDTFYNKSQLSGGSIFGASTIPSTDSVVNVGDSWTVGTGATPTTLGWAYLNATNYNVRILNNGRNGWTLCSRGMGTSLEENLNLVPIKTANIKKLYVMFMINDDFYGIPVATFQATYLRMVDSFAVRGYAASDVVICSQFNNGTFAPHVLSFVAACQATAIAKGTRYMNGYSAIANAPGGESQYMNPDSVHPNNSGHYLEAQKAWMTTTGLTSPGNIIANNLATFNGFNTFNGNVLMNSNSYFVNQSWNGGVNSGIGIATVKSQIGRIDNQTASAAYQINPAAADVPSRINNDSIQIGGWNNAGRLQLSFQRNKATPFLLFDWQGGFQADGITKYVNTNVKYSFNGGGMYVNGIHVIKGSDSVYGAPYMTGDLTYSLKKLNIFGDPTLVSQTRVGMGVDASNAISYWTFGNMSWGLNSSIDGSYTPLMALHRNARSLTVGQDTTEITGAILAVNGTSGGIVFPRMTTTQKNAIAAPTQGTTVYDTTLRTASFWDSQKWVNLKNDISIFTPLTGGTVNLVNGNYNIINPAGPLAALTINLPSSPLVNDFVEIKITQAITAVTYANGTVVGSPTSSVSGYIKLKYDIGTTTWY